MQQLNKIFKMLGTPNEKIWPGLMDLPIAKKINFPHQPYNSLASNFNNRLSQAGFDLLNRMLTYDPEKRISAAEALEHPYWSETPLPKEPDMMPTFPSQADPSSSAHLKRKRGSNDAVE